MNSTRNIFSCIFLSPMIFLTFFLSNQIFSNEPDHSRIELKSLTRTFNHLNDYAIEGGEIWFRPRNHQKSRWQKINFDPVHKGFPVSIQADGANLMILDSNNIIHYKKTIKEWRDKKNLYHYEDLNIADNWIKNWFSLPVLSSIYKSRRLRLPPDITIWANSHRGAFNAYFEDLRGVQHPEFSAITTVFALAPNRQEIFFADPYVPVGLGTLSFEGPMVNQGFIIEQLAASASTVFVLGTLNGEKRMFTRYADFDLLRLNPLLSGYYSPNSSVKQEWDEVPLPVLSSYSRLAGPITILQTGEGNANRELRVDGYHHEGQFGYYYKNINESEWNFIILE